MPRMKFVIAGVLILGAVSLLIFSGINNSMVYYYGVSEVLAKAPVLYDKGIRLSGHVAEGSIQHKSLQSEVRFQVLEKSTGKTIPVIYRGLIPDTFKDHAEVVVEGEYSSRDRVFHATNLLAKCPSKYESMEDSGEDGEASAREAPAL